MSQIIGEESVLRDNSNFFDYEFHSDEDDFDLDSLSDISKAIYAIVHNDVNLFKLVLPTFRDIRDNYGYSLLHIAILKERHEIFDYLLSVGADIEVKDANGDTPLMMALSGFRGENDIPLDGDYFAKELLIRGADNNVKCSYDPAQTPLYLALDRGLVNAAKLLIGKGVDWKNFMEETGWKPANVVLGSLYNYTTENAAEIISMMIYHGLIIDEDDFHSARKYELKDLLFDYAFDDDATITINASEVFDILDYDSGISEISTLPRLFQKISHIDITCPGYDPVKNQQLLSFPSKNLQWLLNKFPVEAEEIIANHLEYLNICENNFELQLQNLEMLLGSDFKFEIIQRLNDGLLDLRFIRGLNYDQTEKFLMFVLSYGVELHDQWMNAIFLEYGYCELFKILLNFEVKISSASPDNIIPRYIYDVHREITWIDEPLFHVVGCDEILRFLPYSSRIKFLKDTEGDYNRDYFISKASRLPDIPSLVELARDSSRIAIVQKYNIRHCGQFYTILRQRLPLPQIIQQIISFETPLYSV